MLTQPEFPAHRRRDPLVNGVDKTYQCGGGMLYHLDDACWLWSDRRQAWGGGEAGAGGE